MADRLMNLGEIVDALRLMPPGAYVTTPIGTPSRVVSYRGVYAHLALEIDHAPHGTIVAVLLEELESLLLGASRSGWKGGEFTYDRESPVWCVLESGFTSMCGVSAIGRGPHDIGLWKTVEMSLGWQRYEDMRSAV